MNKKQKNILVYMGAVVLLGASALAITLPLTMNNNDTPMYLPGNPNPQPDHEFEKYEINETNQTEAYLDADDSDDLTYNGTLNFGSSEGITVTPATTPTYEWGFDPSITNDTSDDIEEGWASVNWEGTVTDVNYGTTTFNMNASKIYVNDETYVYTIYDSSIERSFDGDNDGEEDEGLLIDIEYKFNLTGPGVEDDKQAVKLNNFIYTINDTRFAINEENVSDATDALFADWEANGFISSPELSYTMTYVWDSASLYEDAYEFENPSLGGMDDYTNTTPEHYFETIETIIPDELLEEIKDLPMV